MKNAKLIMVLIVGFILGHFGIQSLNAYGESEGGWTATEKRQVISLLKEIRDNTGE